LEGRGLHPQPGRRGALTLARATALALPLLAVTLAAAEPWTAPAEARARVNPLEPTDTALLKGRALYQKHCTSCHGDKGKGDGPAERFSNETPTDLTDAAAQARWTDGEIFWKISTGRREHADVIMPALANKVPSEEDRWKVVLFVRRLGTPASPGP
jgi:mono/diheme cytochrome c family protein